MSTVKQDYQKVIKSSIDKVFKDRMAKIKAAKKQ